MVPARGFPLSGNEDYGKGVLSLGFRTFRRQELPACFAVLCVFALRILRPLRILNAKTQRTARLANRRRTMRSEKESVKIVRIRFARTRLQRGIARLVLIVMCLLAANCSTRPVEQAPRGLDAIDHIIVIYAENRSFDNLYGLFPGANGLG